nr:MAG TPA: 14-3-3 protein gamma [Bacteriophage sp.]
MSVNLMAFVRRMSLAPDSEVSSIMLRKAQR